jgi:serine protease Do
MNDPKHARHWRRNTLAAALLAGTALTGYVVASAAPASPTAPTPGTETQVANPNGTPTAAAKAPINAQQQAAMPERLPDFTHLVAQVKPAVVSVTNYLKQPAADAQDGQDGQGMPGQPQLPFPFNQFPFGQQTPQQQAHPVEARGSGFIINPDGEIVTNNHVIRDARRITVTLDDGQTLPAHVVGADPRTDIAVLKVDAGHPLPYVALGNSSTVQPGEWVIAIGNPFGLSETVTAGIISALGRNIGAGPYDQFIQVDAPINEGNSGGPLMTQDGKVIGMNTAILSPSGGSIGIGFAVPSNSAVAVINQLREFGETRRGWLGVRIQQVTDDIAESLSVKPTRGALVAGIDERGPAKPGGIEPGDVIVKFDGHEIREMHDLPRIVANTPVGKEVEVVIIRKGKEETHTVKLGRLEDGEKAAAADGKKDAAPEQKSVVQKTLGLELASLSDDLRKKFKVRDNVKGVIVTGVDANVGAAAPDKRLSPGDVIVEVQYEAVANPADLQSRIEALKSEGKKVAVLLVANGDGETRFVALSLQ